MYLANANVHLMKENVTQINGGFMINIYVNVENVMHVKSIIFGMLLHGVVKMKNI